MARRALLVGISNYGRSDWALPGCVQDIEEWGKLLREKYGFRAEDIKTLQDEEATKSAVLQGLDRLLDESSPGDAVVFVYAGHGTTIPRLDSDEGDKEDLLDECLVLRPENASQKAEDYLLRDDDLYHRLTARGAELGKGITLILDSCFSYGMVRNLPGLLSSTHPGLRPRFVTIDIPTTVTRSRAKTRVARFGMRLVSRTTEEETAHILVAAASENEPAWDGVMTDAHSHGLFTYYATRLLAETPNMGLKALTEACKSRIHEDQYSQHPDVRGGGGRKTMPLLGEVSTTAEPPSTDIHGAAPNMCVHGINLGGNKQRFAVEGPWNIRDPMHELITERALKKANLLPSNVSYEASLGWEYIRGAIWNDDPEGLLFDNNANEAHNWSSGAEFLVDFKGYAAKALSGTKFHAGSPIFARSHFGDLQCLHSMGAYEGEDALLTRDNIIAMAEFFYAVASGHIAPETPLNATGLEQITWWFPNEAKSIKNLFNIGQVGNTRMRALGALLHMVEDSFCDAHVERGPGLGPDAPDAEWYVREFHTYLAQDDDLHAKGDAMAAGGIDQMPHALCAIKVCAILLSMWKASEPWSAVREYLLREVYVLADDRRPSGAGARYKRKTRALADGRALATPPMEDRPGAVFMLTGSLYRQGTAKGAGKDFVYGEPVKLYRDSSLGFDYKETIPGAELRLHPELRMGEEMELRIAVTLVETNADGEVKEHPLTLGPYRLKPGAGIVEKHTLEGASGGCVMLNVSARRSSAAS